MHRLLNDPTLCDIELRCLDGTTVHAQRGWLAARSPVFDTLIFGPKYRTREGGGGSNNNGQFGRRGGPKPKKKSRSRDSSPIYSESEDEDDVGRDLSLSPSSTSTLGSAENDGGDGDDQRPTPTKRNTADISRTRNRYPQSRLQLPYTGDVARAIVEFVYAEDTRMLRHNDAQHFDVSTGKAKNPNLMASVVALDDAANYFRIPELHLKVLKFIKYLFKKISKNRQD